MKQLAVTTAHANVDFSEAAILATVGEMGDTVKFLTSSFYKAMKIFKAVKKLDLLYLRKQISLKELRDRYMEYRYAIRPLMHDIKDISNALRHQKNSDRYTFRGFETAEKSFESDDILWDMSGYDMIVRDKCTRTVNVRAGVMVSLDQTATPSVWGLDQPIEAIWELTPFSFIADWFFNIGQTIASWTPNVGVHELASWVTVKDVIHSERRVVDSYTTNSDAEYDYSNHAHVSNCFIEFDKTIVERFVNPTKSFVPHIKVKLDALKLLDLAIICKTLMGNTRKRSNRIAMYQRS
jgi:hypothetical protein